MDSDHSISTAKEGSQSINIIAMDGDQSISAAKEGSQSINIIAMDGDQSISTAKECSQSINIVAMDGDQSNSVAKGGDFNSQINSDSLSHVELFADPEIDLSLPPARLRAAPFATMPDIVENVRRRLGWKDNIDKVSRVNISPEMVFASVLSSTSEPGYTLEVPCIVDTACGLGYLYAPWGVGLERMDSRPYHSSVLLADNETSTSISEAVEVSLAVKGTVKNKVVLLPVIRGGNEFAVLFGRSLLSLFGISTVGGKMVKMDDLVLYDCYMGNILGHEDKIRRTQEPRFDSQGVVPLESKVNTKGVSWVLDHSQQHYLDCLLLELSQLPPQPLPCCPGRVALKSTNQAEVLDTEAQRFAFCISVDHWKIDRTEYRNHNLYSTAMFRKLEHSDRERFCAQVDEYVKYKWWTPASREEVVHHGPPACVFAVRQKKKLRLVIDFRARNKFFPSTAQKSPISFALSVLRTLPVGSIFVADAASAFYRVHADTPAWIHCGELGDFLSHRVSFGMSYGPEALDNSLGVVWKLFNLVAHSGTGVRYVDDVWYHSQNSEDLIADLNSFLFLMDRCGFGVDPSKLQLLSPQSGEVSLFGMRIKYKDHRALSVNCCREKLRTFDLKSLIANPTKSGIFEICGILSYDPLRVHLEEKLLSDLLRSVVGCYGDWHGPLDLHEFSEIDKKLYQGILFRIGEIISASDHCVHCFDLPERADDKQSIRLLTDASHSGGGFLIQIDLNKASPNAVWTTIYADAWWHKRAELRSHSNRWEAACLFRGLRSLSKFLEFSSQSRSASTTYRNVQLTVQTDNTSALAWAQKPPISEGYEYRAVERLSEALRAELFHLKSMCSIVEVGHIAGKDNIDADNLSRCLSKFAPLIQARDRERVSRSRKRMQVTQNMISRVSHEDTIRRTTNRNSQVAEIINGRSNPYRSWLEDAGHDSYSVSNLCFKVSVVRYALNIWYCAAKKIGAPAPPKLYTAEDELAAIRLSQSNMAGCMLDVANEGQLHYDPSTDIVYLQRALPTGQYQFVPYIPSCSVLHSLILRDGHRQAKHMGVDYTLSKVSRFGLQRPVRRALSLIQGCIHCQMKNASRRMNGPVHMVSDITNCPPFSYWAIDHVAIGNKVVALSMMCLSTGYCSFAYCADHGFKATWEAFANLLDKCPRGPSQVFSDKASVFALVLERYQQTFGVAVEHLTTSGHAAFENGKLERLHRSGLSILGTKTHLEKLTVTQSTCPLTVQRLLDSCSKVLNGRPLGQVIESPQTSRFIVTPNVLVYGPDDVLFEGLDAKFGLRTQSAWLHAFRTVYWQRLKAASCTNQAKRSGERLHTRFICNEPVIYVTKTKPGKLDFGVHVGHVKTVVDNKLQLSSGKWISIHNCVKLKSISVGGSAYDVKFVGARCSIYMEDQLFHGSIIDHQADGMVTVRWDVVNGQGWLDELLPPSELTLQEGAC